MALLPVALFTTGRHTTGAGSRDTQASSICRRRERPGNSAGEREQPVKRSELRSPRVREFLARPIQLVAQTLAECGSRGLLEVHSHDEQIDRADFLNEPVRAREGKRPPEPKIVAADIVCKSCGTATDDDDARQLALPTYGVRHFLEQLGARDDDVGQRCQEGGSVRRRGIGCGLSATSCPKPSPMTSRIAGYLVATSVRRLFHGSGRGAWIDSIADQPC